MAKSINIEVFTFNAFSENMYVLWDQTKDAIIIDPGCYQKDEEQKLASFIEKQGLKIVGLYNTHCHIDHVLGNQFVKDTYQVKLGIHKIEEEYLQAVSSYAPRYGFANYQNSEADFFIDQNDQIKFGNSELSILFVPGHSAGHLAFYHAEDGFCINGDVLFRESIGRTDLPGGNHQVLLTSIQEKMFALPDNTIIHCGHGGTTTIAHEKQHNPFCKLAV